MCDYWDIQLLLTLLCSIKTVCQCVLWDDDKDCAMKETWQGCLLLLWQETGSGTVRSLVWDQTTLFVVRVWYIALTATLSPVTDPILIVQQGYSTNNKLYWYYTMYNIRWYKVLHFSVTDYSIPASPRDLFRYSSPSPCLSMSFFQWPHNALWWHHLWTSHLAKIATLKQYILNVYHHPSFYYFTAA